MSTWVLILLFSVGAVLLFVIGMSLTLMIKGHHIESEIASNPHMRARGITCAVHDALGAPGTPGESKDCPSPDPSEACSATSCATCTPTFLRAQTSRPGS